MNVYISGKLEEDGIKVSLQSSVIVFLVNYCHVGACPLQICIVDDTVNDSNEEKNLALALTVDLPTTALNDVAHSFLTTEEVPQTVRNCAFPVFQDESEKIIRCGFCCTVRHIVKVCHEVASKHNQDTTLIDILGFRSGSLKACAEVSGWTKLCEVELLQSIAKLRTAVRQEPTARCLEVPQDVMKLELHFDNPPLLHNDDKMKRSILRQIVNEVDKKPVNATNGCKAENKGDNEVGNGVKLVNNVEKKPVNATKVCEAENKEGNEVGINVVKPNENSDPDTNKSNDDSCISNPVQQFFQTRQTILPHGNMYYRVQTLYEKQGRKFNNMLDGSKCKFGCTENRLIKWCAKCNDREKLKRKEEKQLKNMARLQEKKPAVGKDTDKTSTHNSNVKQIDVESPQINGSSGDSVEQTDYSRSKNLEENGSNAEGHIHTQTGDLYNVNSSHPKTTNGALTIDTNDGSHAVKNTVGSVEELADFVTTLNLNDLVYEHVYAEGVCFTVADIIVFVYIYHMLEAMEFKNSSLLEKLPNINKWLKHVVTLPRMQQTAVRCGFKMTAIRQCASGSSEERFPVDFTIPTMTLDVKEDNPEIARGNRAKHKALKPLIAKVLEKVKDEHITAVVGQHPYGEDIHLDWTSFPLAASPKIELPEKRVARKCEQLENLATAVQSIAKPGDVIVDFCSGAGHLGITIAYLLPDCKVYLVENKEESLVRARNRVLQLQLDNVILYQCNLDYFRGDFDIGVCLHACGVATDLVLQQCLQKQAAFVICPCCYGNIQNTHSISYPRSQYYRDRHIQDLDLIILGHAADQTEENIHCNKQGHECMSLVDTDRCRLAIESGYTVNLCSLQPLSCTPKNNLLIGTR